jgi:putative DNA primase/helicase
VTPARVDQELGAKLRGEWPAILAWMVDGCLAWQREGLNPPARVQAATEDYFAGEDAVRAWIEECCVLDGGAKTPTSELFASWHEWANRSKEFVGSAKRLSQQLRGRGFEPYQDGKTRRHGYKGLRVDINRHDFETIE